MGIGTSVLEIFGPVPSAAVAEGSDELVVLFGDLSRVNQLDELTLQLGGEGASQRCLLGRRAPGAGCLTGMVSPQGDE